MDSEIKYALVKDTSMDINVKYLNKGITLFFSALKQVKISQTSTKLWIVNSGQNWGIFFFFFILRF